MANRSLGSLTLDLVAKTGGFVQGMSKAERATDKFEKEARAHYKRVGAALKQLSVAATAAFAVLGRTAHKALDDIDAMAKTARQLGVATDAMAGLQLAAELGGASAEDLSTALIRLAANAAKGHKAFARLGIAVKNPQGELKSTQELLSELADRFAAMPDGVEKTALATDLLGRSGAKLISMLDGGSAALDDAIAKTRQWGSAVDEDAARAVEKFNDDMRLMREQASGLARRFTVGLLPALDDIVAAFNDTDSSIGAAKAAGEVFGEVLRTMAKVVIVLRGEFDLLGTAIGTVLAKFSTAPLDHQLDELEKRRKRLETERNRLERGLIPRRVQRRADQGRADETERYRKQLADIQAELKGVAREERKVRDIMAAGGYPTLTEALKESAESTAKSLARLDGLTADTGKKSSKAVTGVTGDVKNQTAAVDALQKAYRDMTDGVESDDRNRLQALKKQLEIIRQIGEQYTKGVPGAASWGELIGTSQQLITRSALEGAPDLREKSQTEQLAAWYEKRRKLLKQELDQRIIATREYQQAMLALEKSYNANLTVLGKRAQEKRAEETKRNQETARRQAEQHIENIKSAYQSLTRSLETDDEKRLRTLKEQLDVIKQMAEQYAKGVTGAASPDETERLRKQLLARYEGGGRERPPADIGYLGAYQWNENDKENTEAYYRDQMERLRVSLEEGNRTYQEYLDKRKDIIVQANQAMAHLHRKGLDILLASGEEAFSKMSDAAKAWAGENSGIYRALFATEKAFGIARSIIAIQSGIAQAAANPFPANLAAMASVAAATASIVSTIASVAMPSGMAHEGIDKIPKSGTWMLEKGERVTTANTSAKLDATLEQIRDNQPRAQKTPQHIRIVNTVDPAMVRSYLGSDDGERLILNIIGNNPSVLKKVVSA